MKYQQFPRIFEWKLRQVRYKGRGDLSKIILWLSWLKLIPKHGRKIASLTYVHWSLRRGSRKFTTERKFREKKLIESFDEVRFFGMLSFGFCFHSRIYFESFVSFRGEARWFSSFFGVPLPFIKGFSRFSELSVTSSSELDLTSPSILPTLIVCTTIWRIM